MKIQIERAYVEALVTEFPELQILAEQLKFGNKAEIPLHHFSGLHLGFLRDLYEQAGVGMLGKAAQIGTLQHALMDGGKRFNESDMVCSESAIVGLATAAVQTLIPIPILGAVIGSMAGKILAEFATGKGKDVAEWILQDMAKYMSKIDAHYQAIIRAIDNKFDRLGKLIEAAFDLKRNTDLLFASANLTRVYGVPEKDIITSHSELDDFMLG